MKHKRPMRGKKPLIIGGVLVASIAAAAGVYAAIATVTTTSTAGVGSATISSCDDTWAVVLDAPTVNASGGYEVASVTYSGVAAACNGQTLAVSVNGASGSLGKGSVTLSGTGGSINLDTPASLASVTGLTSAIYKS